MKTNVLKTSIFSAAIILVGSSYIAGLHAQQSPKTSATAATTNWIGKLVVGRNDTVDAIAIGGPHPTVDRQVEIGLRSDGILMWRQAPNTK